MFSQTIQEIKYFGDNFASSKPELKRISTEGFGSDVVAGATLRSLLFNRLPKDEAFVGRYYEVDQGWNDVVEMSEESRRDYMRNAFFVVNYSNEENFTLFEGFEQMQKIDEFFKTFMTCHVIVNPAINSAVVYIKDCNTRLIHLSLCLFPRYYPTYFGAEGKSNLTTEERELCKTLSMRNADEFVKAVVRIGDAAGFEKEYTARLLSGYMRRNVERMIQTAVDERTRAEHRLEQNIEEYRTLYQDLQDKIIRIEGLRAQDSNDDTELADYFAHHDCIRLDKVSGDTLCVYILTEMNWFDLDYYKRASANKSIYAVDHSQKFDRLEDRQLLMDSIFSDDPKFRIRMCAYYEVSMSADVSVHSHWDFPAEYMKKYIPNPHLQIHACLGGYREPIRKRIREGNLMGALDQCIASAQSVNLLERTQTFDPFMKQVFNSNNKILVDNEGNEYTPLEALKKLKEKA